MGCSVKSQYEGKIDLTLAGGSVKGHLVNPYATAMSKLVNYASGLHFKKGELLTGSDTEIAKDMTEASKMNRDQRRKYENGMKVVVKNRLKEKLSVNEDDLVYKEFRVHRSTIGRVIDDALNENLIKLYINPNYMDDERDTKLNSILSLYDKNFLFEGDQIAPNIFISYDYDCFRAIMINEEEVLKCMSIIQIHNDKDYTETSVRRKKYIRNCVYVWKHGYERKKYNPDYNRLLKKYKVVEIDGVLLEVYEKTHSIGNAYFQFLRDVKSLYWDTSDSLANHQEDFTPVTHLTNIKPYELSDEHKKCLDELWNQLGGNTNYNYSVKKKNNKPKWVNDIMDDVETL